MDREITITVTDDEARLIDERVAAGEFESAVDLVHFALATVLGDQLPDVPEDVLLLRLAEDAADEGSDLSADEAFAQVRANLAAKYGRG